MKQVTKYLLFLLITFSIYSCDTLSYIELENKMQSTVYYKTFYHKDSSQVHNDIDIELSKEHPKAGIIFGFGHLWNKNTIKKYVNTIDRIEISSEKKCTSIDNKRNMYQFFLNRRKGLFYSKMKITFEDM